MAHVHVLLPNASKYIAVQSVPKSLACRGEAPQQLGQISHSAQTGLPRAFAGLWSSSALREIPEHDVTVMLLDHLGAGAHVVR